MTEYRHEPVGAAAEAIAMYVARLVPDGATLQIGLGRVPNEMLHHLSGRRDLRVHSDVVTDGLVDLLDSGAVRRGAGHGRRLDGGRDEAPVRPAQRPAGGLPAAGGLADPVTLTRLDDWCR